MVCNVGKLDRIVRAMIAVVLIGMALWIVPVDGYKVPILILGMLFFLSASFGVCFIYKWMGISTAKKVSTLPTNH